MITRSHLGLIPTTGGQPAFVGAAGRAWRWSDAKGYWQAPGLAGLGDYASSCNAQRNWFEEFTLYLYCLPNDAANVYNSAGTAAANAYSDVRYGTVGGSPTIPMPTPPPPGISITTDASAAANPSAVYAGTINGQAYYAVPETPQANMAAFKAKVDDYFNQVGAAADAAACNHWFSMLDPSCPTKFVGTLPILAAVGIAAYMLFRGRR